MDGSELVCHPEVLQSKCVQTRNTDEAWLHRTSKRCEISSWGAGRDAAEGDACAGIDSEDQAVTYKMVVGLAKPEMQTVPALLDLSHTSNKEGFIIMFHTEMQRIGTNLT